ncbi:thioredoxin, mitochondrial-like [Oppia nitens]|uniref:thioredoxin, mitochondrial-like n=1 Tax=Oppia nitens TaxID=1686743 RepID=UPI0023DB2DFB|nr:thioredoxin, mitochondrial-like [Oppia nitens]
MLNKILLNTSRLFRLKSITSTITVRNICLTNSLKDIFKIQDENDFKEKVVNNKNPVIVEFYATWCGPCKLLKPRLETIVGGKGGKLDLALVDVDEHESLAMQYKVGSVPTVVAINGGKLVDQFIGLKDEDQLNAFVGKLLKE